MSHEPKADWFSMSTRILRDRKVQVLIRKHGHEVSTAVIALFSQARLQKKAGEVDISWYDLAHDAVTTEDKAQEIVRAADEVQFLVIDDQDETGVVLHFPAWKRHQNTASQARSRDRKAAENAPVIDCHQVSSNVVLHDKTRQDKTEQEKKHPPGKPVDPDSLPTDFDSSLAPAVEACLPALQRVAVAKRAKPVHRLPLAKAVASYPDRDHVRVAGELEHWCLHGRGETRNQRDIVATFRNFLKNADPVARPAKFRVNYDAKVEEMVL